MPPGPSTVVVGGGISGLTLALRLHQAGVPVTVLEEAARAGGAATTVERDGFLLETGPNSVLDRDGVVQALAETVGVHFRPASDGSGQRAVVIGGRLRTVPGSPPALLRSDLLPTGAKLRLLLEPFTRRAPAGVDESLGDFSRRHLGRTVTATLVDALQTGIWAGDMERLSAASAFPRLVALERTHRSLLWGAIRSRRAGAGGPGSLRLASVEGGLGALSLAVAGALGDRVQLGRPASALGRDGDRWSVATPRGTVSAERLVLALPPDRAARLVRPLDAQLAAALDAFPAVPVAVVHLGYRPGLAPEPEGFGFLVPPGERREILGTVYASAAFPFRAPGGGTLLTVLVGGAHRPELVERDDAALVALARSELAALLGVDRSPTLTQVFRWPHAIPQYEVGHARRVEAAFALAGRWPGLWLGGNAYRGAGVADCVRSAQALATRLLSG
jgi:oxygen-dependent protoporphyrinogen oxidase